MIERYRAYTDMKDSGTKWFGHVPEHWAYVPLFAVTSPKSVTNCPDRELLSVYLNRGVVLFSDIAEKRTNATSSDLSKYQAVDPGDFVLNNQQAWRGSVGVSKYAGIVSPAYLVLSLSSAIHPQYANYLFRDEAMVNQYLVCSKGVGSIQRNLYWPHLKRVTTLVPPIDEQVAIARYLYAVDLKITRFIRNRRRLIAVLNEQKQAIINQAVTRGLNPNTPLKPSGIDWLGDIPAHWEACRLKHLLSRPLTYGANAAAELSDHNCPRYIRITDINKYGQLRSDSFCSLLPKVAEPYMLKDGDILLARSGATVGKSFLYSSQQDGPAAHAGYLINARADQRKVLPAYLHKCLHSAAYWRWIASMTIQATIQNVSAEKYANLWISVPPVDEQLSIIESVEKETTLPMALSSRAEQEIDLIREYRTRLVSDVVTGKIDVRHLAPPRGNEDMKDMAEALEPLEDVIDDVEMDEEEEVNESD